MNQTTEAKKRPGLFEVLQEMSINNLDIARSDGNIQNCNRQPKLGGGTISVGMASPAFDKIINGLAVDKPTHHAILFVFSEEDYRKVEKSLLEKP